MNLLLVLLVVGAGGALFFFWPKKAIAGVSDMSKKTLQKQKQPTSLDELFTRWGTYYEVDPVLLKAIAMQESSLNPNAVNPADPSIGLMQILCKPDGHGGCSNRFDVDGWAGITREKLFDPDTNIMIGSQILAWNIKTYGFNRGIATYNNWSARNAPEEGPYPNQGYVDSVLNRYNKLLGVI